MAFALNSTDVKSAFIAIAIAGGGALYWKYRQGKSSGGNAYNGMLNNASASSGGAGAIAPSSTINTYNVFPTVSSQMSTPNSFYNGPASTVGPSPLRNRVWLTNGQTFSLPINT